MAVHSEGTASVVSGISGPAAVLVRVKTYSISLPSFPGFPSIPELTLTKVWFVVNENALLSDPIPLIFYLSDPVSPGIAWIGVVFANGVVPVPIDKLPGDTPDPFKVTAYVAGNVGVVVTYVNSLLPS